jgi:hypothetical protein
MLGAAGLDAEVEVVAELARVKASLGREGVANLVWEVNRRQGGGGSLDEDEVTGGANAETDLAGGLQLQLVGLEEGVATSKVVPSHSLLRCGLAIDKG